MKINFTLDWKAILKLIGGAAFAWLIRHILDELKAFEFLKKQYQEHDVQNKAISFFYRTVTVLDILLFILLATIGYFIFNWLFKKLWGKEERHKANIEKIKKFNTKTVDNFTFKWTVAFSNGKPYVNNLQPYCARHTPAIPMPYDQPLEMHRCQSCPNSLTRPFIAAMGTYNNDFGRYESIIQAELEHQWEQLNAK